MKLLKSPLVLILTFALPLPFLFGCPVDRRFHHAKSLYEEEDYEAALEAINRTTETHPVDNEYTLLKTQITSMVYASRGFPVIAYYLLTSAGGYTISGYDYSSYQHNILSQISKKFKTPVVLHFLGEFSETDRQSIESRIKDALRELSNDKWCSFNLVDNTNLSSFVLLEIVLNDFSFELIKQGHRTVSPSYGVEGTIKTPSEYLAVLGEIQSCIDQRRHLQNKYTGIMLDKELDPARRLFRQKVLSSMISSNERKIRRLMKALDSASIYGARSSFNDYHTLNQDYVLQVDMNLKYRVVDSGHQAVWKEDIIHFKNSQFIKEIDNLDIGDVPSKSSRALMQKSRGAALRSIKEQAYYELVKTLKHELRKILYYRGKDYERLGLEADAWENYYVFIKTTSQAKEEYFEAESFIQRDPLKLNFSINDLMSGKPRVIWPCFPCEEWC